MSVITQTPMANNRTQNRSIPSTHNSNIASSTQGSHRHSNNLSQLPSKNKIRKPSSLYDPESQNSVCIQEESLLAINTEISFKDNITKEQRSAIKSLKEKIDNREIIATKADKGSGIVITDYSLYLKKGTQYIEEEAKAYELVISSQKQIVQNLLKARNSIVCRLKEADIIEPETATYCIKQLEEKITGIKFYFKIHKDSNIQTMPLRPLQSCIHAPTHHLSQVLTDIMQPFLKVDYIPTYIADSNQLLYRLNLLPPLNQDWTLISSDVAALYPSIPHKEGMLAVREFLEGKSMYSPSQILAIIKALELVIIENYVMWDSKIYKQNSGVAMGMPVAVAYANIFMNWVDEEIKRKAPYVVEHIRYIDDNLFVLLVDKIDELMVVANSILKPNIRFTYERLDRQSEVGLAFLDTQLFIDRIGVIESRLYTKKTDRHAYLLPSSYHPRHITKNIPLAVFNRLRRICSKLEWFQVDAVLAVNWLENRGYKYRDIKLALDKSMSKDRWSMIQKIEDGRQENLLSKKEKDKYKILFIVIYSQKTKLLKKVLNKRRSLLDASFITKVRLRLAFRRQRNISDLIIQKSLRGPIKGNADSFYTFTLCGDKPKYRTVCPCKGPHDQRICRCCVHARTQLDGIEVRLNKQVDCDSKNIIYLIGCSICGKRYVGETQQKLKERLLQHLNNITILKQTMYIHFNTRDSKERRASFQKDTRSLMDQ